MPGALRCIKAGDALVVHRQDADVAELAAFAAALAPDPSHVVLVLGSGADHPGEDWAPLLPVLVAAARDVRLVPGTASATTSVKLGRWLAPQLGKAVLAYDGVALPAPRGALFVPSANGTGWVRCGSGQEPSSGSRRFPSPGWSCAILEHDMLTEAAVAEPLPGGAWIRSQIAADVDRQRQRLISRLDRSDEHAYVVLGSPDAPPLAPGDVQAFWRLLPPGTRAAIRFVPYGPVAVPDGQSLDQALAEWLGERVTVCPQTPWSTEEPEPPVLRKGRATPDPEAVPPTPESVFPKPEMVSPEPFSRPLAHETRPGSDALADDDTMPLPVMRVPEEPSSPDPAPAQASAPAPAPAPATPSATAERPADGLRRRNSPRRMPRGMRWPAVAAVACLAIAVPVSVIALQSSAGPARVLAAPGPSLTPASQAMTPTVSPSSSATSRGPARSTALTEDQPSQGTATQAARSSKVFGAPTVTGSSSPQGSTGTSNSNGSSSGGSSSPGFGSGGSGSGGFGADGSGFGSGGSGSNGNGSGGGGTSGSGSSGSGSSGSGSVGSSSGTASNPTPTQTQTAPASTNACAPAWDSTSVYVAGDEVSDNGDNWTANQWNDDEAPGGAAGAWNDDGAC